MEDSQCQEAIVLLQTIVTAVMLMMCNLAEHIDIRLDVTSPYLKACGTVMIYFGSMIS